MNVNGNKLLGGLIVTALALPSGSALASSHREAPLISTDPTADSTDVYAFVSPDKPDTVTMIANFIPLEEPAGGPNFFKFDDFARYEIKIDNNGDALEDITFRFTFKTKTMNSNTFLNFTGPVTSLTDPDLNVRQTMTVQMIVGGVTSTIGSNINTVPCNVGPSTMPDYPALADSGISTLFINSIKVFAGQREEGFFVDLGSVFDLLQLRAVTGSGDPTDSLAGFNTHSIAIQVPIYLLTKDGSVPSDPANASSVLGLWSTVSRQSTRVMSTSGTVSYTGNWVQVSRLGMPLVNEAVIPLGFKNRFNASRPKDDAQFLKYVQNPELAVLLNALFGLPVPPTPRNDLVAVFLTGVSGLNSPPNVSAAEMLRLNVAIDPAIDPDPYGVLAGDLAGFPNGRRLEDDIVDISLLAVGGILVAPEFNYAGVLTDGVDYNDVEFLPTFPYLAHPRSGFDSFHGIAY